MLSGKAPFQTSCVSNSNSIVEKIRGGEFSFSGKEWQCVSDKAKKIIKGEPSRINALIIVVFKYIEHTM